MNPCPDRPGHCDTCGRRVRWADIQTCRHAKPPPAPTCHRCVHKGDAALAPDGLQIGEHGCGCGGRQRGPLWWHCKAMGHVVREDKAARCSDFSPT